MKYHFKIHKEGKGYWAECMELSGCQTQAKTVKELQQNMEEALNLFLDEPHDSTVLVPLPKSSIKGRNIVEVAVDPKIAFATYLRHIRLCRKMTQREVAGHLGLKNIYSYQRLESAKTANPTLSTLSALKKLFREFDLEKLLSA